MSHKRFNWGWMGPIAFVLIVLLFINRNAIIDWVIRSPEDWRLIPVSEGARDSMLNDSIYPIDQPTLKINDTDLNLIGADFGKEDLEANGFKKNANDLGAIEAFSQGFKIGIARSHGEAKKRDATLVLYLKAKPSSEITSPRDIKQSNIKAKITDDKGEDGIELYNSFSGKYLELNKDTYGIFIFAVYSDSKYFDIAFGNTTYRVALPFKQ
ncbi:hypothetical protein [Paenibacillus azoreducens]|uniref:Uncharacterized protein n=1 Tax=Paenibacillus azoreducens TaxID=116718 RepID=A0A919YCQ2_9BACL|nr:hypothetical protein [Paenibacillus azoreducens]GIO48029.1 hypothetical protein J34TS1_27940 [Paenibacillus azoreducens]